MVEEETRVHNAAALRSRREAVLREKLAGQLLRNYLAKTGQTGGVSERLRAAVEEAVGELLRDGKVDAHSARLAFEGVLRCYPDEVISRPRRRKPATADPSKHGPQMESSVPPTPPTPPQVPTSTLTCSTLWPRPPSNPRKQRLQMASTDDWTRRVAGEVKRYHDEVRWLKQQAKVKAEEQRRFLDEQVATRKRQQQREIEEERAFAAGQVLQTRALEETEQRVAEQQREKRGLAQATMREQLRALEGQKKKDAEHRRQQDAAIRQELVEQVRIAREEQLHKLQQRRAARLAAFQADMQAADRPKPLDKPIVEAAYQKIANAQPSTYPARVRLLEDKLRSARLAKLEAFAAQTFTPEMRETLSIKGRQAEQKAQKELEQIEKKHAEAEGRRQKKREELKEARKRDLAKQLRECDKRKEMEKWDNLQTRREVEKSIQEHNETLKKQRAANLEKTMDYIRGLSSQVKLSPRRDEVAVSITRQ